MSPNVSARRPPSVSGTNRCQPVRSGAASSSSVSARSCGESVAIPAHRFNQSGLAWISLDLLPDPTNVHIHRTRINRKGVSPDFAQERVAREHDARMFHKIKQKIVFLWFHVDQIALN